jgi:signal transduction histidine kinase
VNSNSLKWSLGLGFAPVHYFVVNQMLLMLGNLEETVRDFEFRILDYFAGQLTAILDQDRDFEAMMHQTELDNTEKMHVMQDLSANIAHEMRTPLSGVRATMDGLETILPKLVEVYRQSIGKSPETLPSIPEDRLRILENTPERITLMIDQANSVIDMLLMNLRDNKVDKKQFRIFSAATCINQALERYPFKRGEKEKITLDIEEGFYFLGLDSLFIFVFLT